MNVAKLFAINILIAILAINLIGCVDFKERVQAVQALCSTDTDCMKWDPYFDALGTQATAKDVVRLKAICGADAECLKPYLETVDPGMDSPTALDDALELKAKCDSDPEDLMDYQECP